MASPELILIREPSRQLSPWKFLAGKIQAEKFAASCAARRAGVPQHGRPELHGGHEGDLGAGRDRRRGCSPMASISQTCADRIYRIGPGRKSLSSLVRPPNAAY